ncbi:hypothetical protein NA57DRAFT_58123 [Rhizodiscina lignyota]|uniref:Beta-glucuronidase C-terminal domain-containing protein n=1 Tax=Rhizodiscina lignyota TaxID=1504668 RepID=A0A9P4IG36_9PEZI|nr:hypothetical protein NA57DRAFT_58123 [Rhizodiscina lignyota]
MAVLTSFAVYTSLLFSIALAAPAPAKHISLPRQPPSSAVVVPKDLVSLSIEFKRLPKYAGDTKSPNTFSLNLLNNLKQVTGVFPVCRVGGNSQDDAIYNATQSDPEVDLPIPPGYIRQPASIGASFFDSYRVWPAKFIAGIDLARNDSIGVESVNKFTELSCKALGKNLFMWESGNEPDQYASNWGRRDPTFWTIENYVAQWKNYSSKVQDQVAKSCPQLRKSSSFFGPSMAGINSDPDGFGPVGAFVHGIDSNPKTPIQQISTHNYAGGAGLPGVSLQATLMNHTAIMNNIQGHLNIRSILASDGFKMPFTIGETNSLFGGGASGTSNTYGAGLWTADYSLWIGSVGIQRVQFHQSYGAAYSAWNPVEIGSSGPPATLAPYYGKIFAAKFIGSDSNAKIANIPIAGTDGLESMYAAYGRSGLERIAILNLKLYNSTDSTSTRDSRTYSVQLPQSNSNVRLERLQAAGADVTSGITFGGYSYDYALGNGKPVKVKSSNGVTTQKVKGSALSVTVADSEALLVTIL